MIRMKGAFVGFGEVNSPMDIIERKCGEAKAQLLERGITLVSPPVVTDDYEGKAVNGAIDFLKGERFDFLVVCVAGWIPTHAVIDVIRQFKSTPMVLWGLSGYYEEGRLVTTADQAGTGALRKVMQDMGFCFKYVYNLAGKSDGADKVLSFAKAASASAKLACARIGMMGYRDMRLYGTLHEGTSLRAKIGPDVEIFEMLEMVQRAEKLTEMEIDEVLDRHVRGKWEFVNEANEEVLRRGAAYYLAIRQRVVERGYDAVSLIDVDGMKKLLSFPPAMVFMLLAEDPGVCTVPENDAMGAVTQLMARYLTGQISAYMEFYEYMEDRVLVGVPDYVPGEVVDGPVKVMFAGFGDIGAGVMNVSKVKTGPVSLFRLTYTGDRYAMHMVTATAVTPRKWEEAGWKQPAPQLPGLELILDVPVDDFAQKILSQHYIVTYGDNTEAMRDLCRILDIPML